MYIIGIIIGSTYLLIEINGYLNTKIPEYQ